MYILEPGNAIKGFRNPGGKDEDLKRGSQPRPSMEACGRILTNMGHLGHILEVGLFGLLNANAFLLAQSLKKFEQNLLRDLAPSSFQVGEASQPKVPIQIVGCRVERPPHSSSTLHLTLKRPAR